MQIVDVTRGEAPLKKALLNLDANDLDVVIGALRRLYGKDSLFPRTIVRRTRAKALLDQLGVSARY